MHLEWMDGFGEAWEECNLCGCGFRSQEPALSVQKTGSYGMVCRFCAMAGPAGAAGRVRERAERARRFADELDAMAGEVGALDDWRADMCPRCGAAMGAGHHPLCQDGDGTPTGLSDEAAREAVNTATWTGWAFDESAARSERPVLSAFDESAARFER